MARSTNSAPASETPKIKPLKAFIVRKVEGYDKPFWHEIGVAFPHKEGDGLTLQVHEGISVSGRIVILPQKPKDAAED